MEPMTCLLVFRSHLRASFFLPLPLTSSSFCSFSSAFFRLFVRRGQEPTPASYSM